MNSTLNERFRFHTRVRVRFSETDAQGVVYHANYLVYCEVARVEYARTLLQPIHWEATVAHAEVDYKASARFDDELDIAIRISRLGKTSYANEYVLARVSDSVVCAVAKTTQVIIDRATRRPCPLPGDLVEKVIAYERVAPER